jgi:hypothetical protein
MNILLKIAVVNALENLLDEEETFKHRRWMREQSDDRFYVTGLYKQFDADIAAIKGEISEVNASYNDLRFA